MFEDFIRNETFFVRRKRLQFSRRSEINGYCHKARMNFTEKPTDLAIDFRDWAGANNQPSWTVGNVTASALPSGAKFYQDNIDGLGVLGGENDEIDNISQFEQIEVTIAGRMLLSGMWLTDIFLSSATGNSPSENYNRSNPDGEPGQVLINGTTTISFKGIESNTGSGGLNGELFVSFGGPIVVNSAVFSILPDASGNYSGIEYSVAGFTSVPEPTTMLILGVGLLGIAGIRRFRK